MFWINCNCFNDVGSNLWTNSTTECIRQERTADIFPTAFGVDRAALLSLCLAFKKMTAVKRRWQGVYPCQTFPDCFAFKFVDQHFWTARNSSIWGFWDILGGEIFCQESHAFVSMISWSLYDHIFVIDSLAWKAVYDSRECDNSGTFEWYEYSVWKVFFHKFELFMFDIWCWKLSHVYQFLSRTT